MVRLPMLFRRFPSSLSSAAAVLHAWLLVLMLGCGDDKPAAMDDTPGEVGSPCTAEGDDCGPDRSCAQELTGGAAFSIIVDPLPAIHGYCSAMCDSNAECGERGVCFGRGLLGSGGECRRACASTTECATGLECATAGDLMNPLLPNTCQPLPVPDLLAADEAGKHCTEDSECGDGYCQQAADNHGGVCTGLCIADENCGAGGVCVRGVYGSRGTCSEACETDADCQNDQRGWGCGPEKRCVPEADPLPAVGEPCNPKADPTDCGVGSCRTEGLSGEKYPGGYCIGNCDEDADCGALGVCINGLTCLRSCSSDDDCRPEYKCQIHPQATGDSKQDLVCFPREHNR
jgi:hypothetical protein